MQALGCLCMLDDYDIEVHQLDDIIITQNELYDEDDITVDEHQLVMEIEHIDEVEADIYDELLVESLVIELVLSLVQIDEQKLDILEIDMQEYHQYNNLFFI